MRLSEFELIRKYFNTANLAFEKNEVLLGIGDDAALLNLTKEQELAISTDVLVESVHFPAGAEPAKIASRALAVNLSDLAAMGAKPLCFTLGLVLADANESWINSFSRGLAKTARQFNIALVGGDVSKGPTTIAIQVQGLTRPGKALRRDGARLGDQVYVTGDLGDGAIALASLGIPTHLGDTFLFNENQPSSACSQYLEKAYYEPEPRIEFARLCAEFINSAIDVSDGLLGDLGHICKSSGMGARINIEDIPFSDSARCCVTSENLLRAALYGGDDYELCVTVAEDKREQFLLKARESRTKITCIGEIVEGNTISFLNTAGAEIPLEQSAYEHF